MMPPGSRASLADLFFVIGDASWSSFLILFDAGSAQALAGEIDPVRIMDEAIKDRIGVRGLGELIESIEDGLVLRNGAVVPISEILERVPILIERNRLRQ